MAVLNLFWILVVQFCITITYCNCNGLNVSNIPAILAFGDSVFDTGNNNYITTRAKADHVPYGIDFPGRVPTGRFSDGKLVSDMFVSMIGRKETLPPFLQQNLSDHELLTGVCFASAGSGLDNQTTADSKAIPVLKQPEYLLGYIERLKMVAGEQEAGRIVSESLVLLSAGANDLIPLYVRPGKNSNISGYQDFVLNNLQHFLKNLYDLGCRKMVVAGLPPLGCLPLVITAKTQLPRKCIEAVNSDVEAYNKKLMNLLTQVQENLPGSLIFYADAYNPTIDMVNNFETYGFEVTARGCCGTGLFETAAYCNRISPVCKNPSKYLFWDSVHLSEHAYRHLTDQIAKQLQLSPNVS